MHMQFLRKVRTMSEYVSIVPEDISSNTFDFHGASIELICSNPPNIKPWQFFLKGSYGYTDWNASPPHFVGIKSSKQLIVNRFDFTDIMSGNISRNRYVIESSIDGEVWNILAYGSTTAVDDYTKTNHVYKFNPIKCKYIRLKVNYFYPSTTEKHLLENFWGCNFKIYGALPNPIIYANQDTAYYIPKVTSE